MEMLMDALIWVGCMKMVLTSSRTGKKPSHSTKKPVIKGIIVDVKISV
jgi:hypothetical protein